MKAWRRGGVTVFVSLMMAVLLGFLQICLQSAQDAMRRSQTQEALELAEVSVLSEYQKELLESYDLFYLDLGYGTGQEDTAYLKKRISGYLNANLPSGEVEALEVWDISRATDDRGLALYEQAVSCMKEKCGVSVLEGFQRYEELGREGVREKETYATSKSDERANLEVLKKRREEEEQEGTADPTMEMEQLRSSSLLQLLVKEPTRLSGKKANLGSVPSVRQNLRGTGSRGKEMHNAVNDAFFYLYLKEHFTKATDFLAEGGSPGGWLDYQMEYVIAGKETDLENLEYVCGRILAIREGMNYAYLRTDAAKAAECEALAAALVGVTLIPGLVEAMKQVLLVTWAFAESVMDLRLLLEGKQVAFWKTGETWKLSLEGALDLTDGSAEAEREGDENGLNYQDYLLMLLTVMTREEKTERSLDVIEGVVQGRTDGKHFCLDQCTDGFRVRVIIENSREWTAERWFCYEW